MTVNLVYPALALIFWIFIVGLILIKRRRDALLSRAVRPEQVNVSTEAYPIPARLASANFSNQFESPVIFFALIMLAMEVKATSHLMTLLAWLYVASRIVHTLIHIGPNKLPLRGAIYGVGMVALLGLWFGVVLAVV
ncbi:MULTISPECIES: MAPEG family protein [unclassified Bosea (in: a-proteobacteria)]|uniref:MAPEG family protein n=1 Tax=unclassified Bosea (in: a-proteobacteria) TaxID=2653178 RepID=UPI0009550426|nr:MULTISPECIES: MAPEG family protein [unclassified Bosea (in: a-proteobacteria)]TAJ28238.1 MAG: hypothetical protein EPO59_18960 [Bosea sp. (in: a-proteobacteria)]SIR06879.1 hypothetical protein SAMN05880592_10924 [Bosea sp. TND4EK4]